MGVYECGDELMDLVMKISPHYWLEAFILTGEFELSPGKTMELQDQIISRIHSLAAIDFAAYRFKGECAKDLRNLIYYTIEGGYAGSITYELSKMMVKKLESGSYSEKKKALEAINVLARLLSRPEIVGDLVLNLVHWLGRAAKQGLKD